MFHNYPFTMGHIQLNSIPTTLCRALVCSLPFSPIFVLHTISSLPILVTPLRCCELSYVSGLGSKQYKYCRTSRGDMQPILPKTSSLLVQIISYLKRISTKYNAFPQNNKKSALFFIVNKEH